MERKDWGIKMDKPKEYIIIDYDCGICTHTWNYYLSFDINQHLTPIGLASIPDSDYPFKNEVSLLNINFVDANGRVFHKARAIFEAQKRLSGFWKIAGYIGANPIISALFVPIYALIRDNRSLISKMLGMNVCTVNFATIKK